jgi:peptide/nickel transport system ATP-binding protein/oligopeptide transport system ATP-binding protein
MVEVKNLHKAFDLKKKPRTYAVYDFSLNIRQGEVLGLVGESGCGKSTLGKLILKLEQPTKGSVVFEGTDITRHGYSEIRKIRNRMQMIFQGVSTAFNPYHTVNRIIGEPFDNYNPKAKPSEKNEKITGLLEKVGLGVEYLGRYPSEMSGGQRQRVGIARALVLDPKFVVCDESVSSVDHAVKNTILNLLLDLKRERGCTYLFISHDLSSVSKISDRVAVMYLGNLVEVIPKEGKEPKHPYTKALVAASLSPDPANKNHRKVMFKTDEEMKITDAGCVFHNRCLESGSVCLKERPKPRDRGNGHVVACHIA